MNPPPRELLSINTATVRKQWGLSEIIAGCARRGIRQISPWRDQVQATGLANISKLVKAHGLELSGYCRGGMFPASTPEGLKAAHDDNRPSIDGLPRSGPAQGLAADAACSHA